MVYDYHDRSKCARRQYAYAHLMRISGTPSPINAAPARIKCPSAKAEISDRSVVVHCDGVLLTEHFLMAQFR
jgi:hypothetical protein